MAKSMFLHSFNQGLFTWPTLPGCFNEIPPLEQQALITPLVSIHTAPTVSNYKQTCF